jgi:Domain of unknown function (DUF6456)
MDTIRSVDLAKIGGGIMSQGRRPYNPALSGPQVHDRRAREINRGSTGHIVEVEVDDPYETGARISAVRSVRDDPLADQRARGHIDEAQFLAGRQFQKDFEIAERGPKAIALSEAVDSSPSQETLTDAQLKAGKALSRCYGALGKDGSTLAHEMLIRSMTLRQIAISRGMPGREWERYLGRRIHEVLNCLAVTYGFASEETKSSRNY